MVPIFKHDKLNVGRERSDMLPGLHIRFAEETLTCQQMVNKKSKVGSMMLSCMGIQTMR